MNAKISSLKNLSTNLSMVLSKNDRSEVRRSTVGVRTWLRNEHYLNLATNGWRIVASCQTGTKDLDQVRDK